MTEGSKGMKSGEPAGNLARRSKIVVIGGSAGALEGLLTIVAQLDRCLAASICVVLHLGKKDGDPLLYRLQKASTLPCSMAHDGDKLASPHIYLCPPDRHLFVADDRIRLGMNPRVNRARPSIDLAMRSAAVMSRGRAIGVVLSGMLDDGTAGLLAMHRCGGVTIVQDPQEALYPDMPQSVLNAMTTSYKLTAREIGHLLNQLVATPVEDKDEVPTEIRLEHEFDFDSADDLASMNQIGPPAMLGCPDCGGPLWEISHKEPLRYRCHVGHSMTVRTLLREQDRQVEAALWTALRVMEEHARTQDRLSQWEATLGRRQSANVFQERAAESRGQARRLRDVLVGLNTEPNKRVSKKREQA